MIKNYYEFQPASGGKPKQIVILLHGVGSNGRDLISLAPYWSRAIPEAIFISPDAPYPFDQVPPGYDAWQWFPLYERTFEGRMRGLQAVTPLVHNFMDEQLKRFDLEADKLALVGFSQGTMTSLYVGPRYKKKIAGVLGYSGALIWEENPPEDMNIIPIHLVHGDEDEVVPFTAYDYAMEKLKEYGFSVTGDVSKGIAHSIDEEGIESGARFLQSILA